MSDELRDRIARCIGEVTDREWYEARQDGSLKLRDLDAADALIANRMVTDPPPWSDDQDDIDRIADEAEYEQRDLIYRLSNERDAARAGLVELPEGLTAAREIAQRLADELRRHGWGDFHYGSQGQQPSVADLIAEFDALPWSGAHDVCSCDHERRLHSPFCKVGLDAETGCGCTKFVRADHFDAHTTAPEGSE